MTGKITGRDTRTKEQRAAETEALDKALALARQIDADANEPEKASARLEKRLGLKKEPGLFAIIAGLITSYKQKGADVTDADWLKTQMAQNQEYAAGKTPEQIAEAANGIVGGIADYEQAKQELQRHLDDGGTRQSWLRRKIEQGAEANGYADADQYADEVAAGLDDANKEILALRTGDEEGAK
jgi:hypothetical protein